MPAINRSHSLSKGLVGAWAFYEGAGLTLHDLSPNHNDGTLTNGPTWSAGKFGWCLSFDGSNDYVTAPNNSSLNLGGVGQSMSISLWFTSGSASQASKTILGKTDNASIREYEFKTDGSGNPTWQMYDGSNNPYIVINASRVNGGAWHNATLVRNVQNSQMILYLDGISLNDGGSNTGINSNFSSSNAFTIGNAAGGVSGYWNGKIDNVCVYNRALSTAEARNIYTDQFAIYRQPDNRWLKTSAAPTAKLFKQSNLIGIGSGGPFFQGVD